MRNNHKFAWQSRQDVYSNAQSGNTNDPNDAPELHIGNATGVEEAINNMRVQGLEFNDINDVSHEDFGEVFANELEQMNWSILHQVLSPDKMCEYTSLWVQYNAFLL